MQKKLAITSFGKAGPGYFIFLWFVAYVLSVMVWLLFLLVPSAGYVLWLWLFLDSFIYVSILSCYVMHLVNAK